MNAELLLKYFDRISEAPDAMPRLRRLILDLAVRGRLVEQDPTDEPVGELMDQCTVGKDRMLREGIIRQPSPQSPLQQDEIPFSVPTTWLWVRLGEVGAVVGGGTPPSADSECFTEPGKGIAWVTPADMGRNQAAVIARGQRDLTDKGLALSSATVMPKGTVLFTSRAPIGYTAIAANDMSTNQGLKSVVPYVMDTSNYVALYFRAFAPWIEESASGTTFKEVSGRVVSRLPIPLPPLREQQRIVAKVNELMVLCDDLEKAQANREERRDRLVTVSMTNFNGSDMGNLDNSSESIRFYLSHLAHLTGRPEDVEQLRHTVLSLAVRGALVPQNPKDELASNLLERLTRKRDQSKNGRNRAKAPEGLESEDTPGWLPNSWGWVRLGQLADIGTGTTPSRTTTLFWEGGTIPWVTSGLTSRPRISSVREYVTQAAMDQCRLRLYQPGTLIVALYGQGKTRGQVAMLDIAATVNQACAAVSPIPGFEVMQDYLRVVLRGNYEELRSLAAGGTQPNLNLQKLKDLWVPLPPLDEQRRITARVDELMEFCSELENRMQGSVLLRQKLLEAVLQEVLTG